MGDNRDRIELWLADKVPGASFDDAGTASVQRDPDTVVVLELSPAKDICHFCALVAPLSEEMPEASLFAALELNRFGKPLGGCWLAWEPDLQMLTLNWNLVLADADDFAFGNALDNFISAIDTARAELLPAPAERESGRSVVEMA